MIRSKADLYRYLESDRKALNISRKHPRIFGDEIWKFEIALRKYEYYHNCNSLMGWMLVKFWHLRYKMLGLRLGFSIPINVIDEGLCIYHYGSIVISRFAKIGKWCEIHSGVNIGQNWHEQDTPTIGDNCFIGPGAKIFGRIKIGNRIVIGANAVVNKSFETDDVTIAGIPARVVKETGRFSHA